MKNRFSKNRKGGCLFKLIKLTVLLAILLVAAIFFGSSYFASAGLSAITKMVGIESGVGIVSINPFKQSLSIDDFWLKNPEGFKDVNAIKFDNVYVKLGVNPADLIGKKLVKIDEVTIIGLGLDMEMAKDFSNNISAILDKFKALQSTEEKTVAETPPSEDSKPIKIIINKITFNNGKALVTYDAKSFDVSLPSFELTNVGGTEGYTPVQLVTHMLTGIAANSVENVVKDVTKKTLSEGASGLQKIFDRL